MLEGVDLAPEETYVFFTSKNELYHYALERNIYMKVHFQFRNISKAGMLAKYGSFFGDEYKEWRENEETAEKKED